MISILKYKVGDFLVVQWLRLHASNVGGLGSIPGQGTGSHMPQLRVLLQLRPDIAKNKIKHKLGQNLPTSTTYNKS